MTLYAPQTRPSSTNNQVVCDLRSDTVTKPDAGMRQAMRDALVGDDVYGDDPSVLALQDKLAHMLGKEAALFMPTGTQSNLAALMAHCGRGDEVLVGRDYHIYADEAAGASVLASLALCPLPLAEDGGLIPDQIEASFKPDDPHYPQTRLVCLENTVSGRAISLQRMAACAASARKQGLGLHLDGARFFNATAALNCGPQDLAGLFDTVSVCLSKGLSTPAGSVLVASRELIAKAHRHRKILGGAMRQSGVLAAAGLYALDHNLKRLEDDHRRAVHMAESLVDMPHLGSVTQATNMVFLTLSDQVQGFALQAHMASQGVLISGHARTIRFVLHKDIDDQSLDHVLSAFASYS